MEILKVEKNDKNEIIEISKKSFEWDDYIGQVFDYWLDNGLFIKAVEKDEILGFMHLRFYNTFTWFEGLRVNEKYKKHGVGSELTKKAIELSGNRKNRLIILETNIPSIKLSEKFKFVEIDRIYYKYGEKVSFNELVEKYKLKKSFKKLNEFYLDTWVYFDPEYYDRHIYENDSGLKTLETDPPFILNGYIVEENVSKNKEDECFIVYERKSP
ncbi:MAG: GNAT family N-acetyltransferase [Thermoplasmata archaeon]